MELVLLIALIWLGLSLLPVAVILATRRLPRSRSDYPAAPPPTDQPSASRSIGS